MLGQALRRVARPSAGQARPPRPGTGARPRVDLARCDAPTRVRLQRLAAATEAFRVTDVADPASDRAEVTVVTLGDDDGDLVGQLRREHRADPARRTVVIGRGTTWFDAAFGAGVDVWIDHTADDGTVLAAIVGPRSS
jgi:hypothetical protein